MLHTNVTSVSTLYQLQKVQVSNAAAHQLKYTASQNKPAKSIFYIHLASKAHPSSQRQKNPSQNPVLGVLFLSSELMQPGTSVHATSSLQAS